MFAAAAALLLAVSPAEGTPPPCEDSGLFCDQAVAPGLLKRFREASAEDLAKQGYVGVRVFTESLLVGGVPMVSILRRGDEPPVAKVREAGKPAREVPATDVTWRAATTLSATLKAGPRSYVLSNPDDICVDAWTFAIEVIDAEGVTVRSRDTCALEQSGIDTQELSNLVADDIAGCERLSRDLYAIPAVRLRVCLTLGAPRRGLAADAVNAWERSPISRGSRETIPEDWLLPGVRLEWPDRSLRGRDAVAAFWRVVTNEDGQKDPSDLGLGEIRADYQGATALSDGRVRITGRQWQDGETRQSAADFVQEWALGEDGRWRLASWQVDDFGRRSR